MDQMSQAQMQLECVIFSHFKLTGMHTLLGRETGLDGASNDNLVTLSIYIHDTVSLRKFFHRKEKNMSMRSGYWDSQAATNP